MNYRQIKQKLKPDLIFFTIGFLVFPAIIIIAIYSIFNVKDDTQLSVSFPIDNMSVSIQEVPSKDDQAPDIDPGPMSSSISTVRTGHSDSGYKKSIQNQESINSNGIWSATQYTQGDIIENTYIVQLGDTLWQIANAHYGNGAEWIKILDANKDLVGFLPSGEQALIFPGQMLTLP